jgi:hypothetical protein
MAYRFMEQEEPQLLKAELKSPPDYRSIDLLRMAKEEKGFSEEEYGDLRKSVVEEERSHPTVLKKYKEVTALRDEVNPLAPLKASISAAKRLDSSLRGMVETPELYLQQVGEMIHHLEEELEALSVNGAEEAGSMKEI